MEPSYVGAYWGGRRETARECGSRLAQCIDSLGRVDSVLASWFQRAGSRAAAKVPVASDPESLGELFERGRNRQDLDGERIEELGYSVGMWNRARPAVGLAAHAGSYSDHPGILNSFVLDLPAPEDGAEVLYRSRAAAAVFEAVIRAWEPEWATWTTHQWRDAQSPARREPVVGWFTYLTGSDVPETLSGKTRSLGRGVILEAAPEFGAVDRATVVAIRQHLRQSAL